MDEQHKGSRPPLAQGDVMSVLQFQDELRRLARYHVFTPVEHPLADVVQAIKDHPAFTQSRLLYRVLTGLTYQRGEFRRAEASAFDSQTLRLVIALMNLARTGTTDREWLDAVRAADAAGTC